MNLFSTQKQHFKLPNAELVYIHNFFSKKESDTYFKTIDSETKWQQDNITVYGKTYKQPRLTALFGASNRTYNYSNIIMYPMPFTKTLMRIKDKVEVISNYKFNAILVNLYRDGNDSNSWHADNEKALGKHPSIASVSFGEPRTFHFKHRILKNEKYKLVLEHGSLLIMHGEMQQYWLHQIAKTKRQINPRINLTFRRLIGTYTKST